MVERSDEHIIVQHAPLETGFPTPESSFTPVLSRISIGYRKKVDLHTILLDLNGTVLICSFS
jgi:hypothetical protein